MALISLCQAGNFVHVYDFRVKPGKGDEFIRLFDDFDYSDANPMHKSKAQAKDGVLCRDVNDPDHFYLLGEWRDIKVHAEILVQLAAHEARLREPHRRRPGASSSRSTPKSSRRRRSIFSTRPRPPDERDSRAVVGEPGEADAAGRGGNGR